jgi:hypothetical protein
MAAIYMLLSDCYEAFTLNSHALELFIESALKFAYFVLQFEVALCGGVRLTATERKSLESSIAAH